MKHRADESPPTGWYEASLSVGERKRRGHFSTPHALVDQILDACGYTVSADLRHLRLLDPACGSGNFLAQAAGRLSMSARFMGLDQEEAAAVVSRNLWGLDPDPVACCLAEMQVRATLAATSEACSASLPLHIHQADSLTLPWQPCVDLLVANPPYLAAKNTDLSHYRQACQRGQADSYLLFLDLALRIVRPGGWLGLVLPDPVLARANAASERARLLRECTVQQIWHLSGVFAAEVGAVVIIAQKISPRSLHRVSWIRDRWRTGSHIAQTDAAAPEQHVSQTLLARQPGAELRYLLSHEQGRVVERLRRALDEQLERPANATRLIPLAELVDIKRGEEIGRESSWLGPLSSLEQGYPVLRGGVDLRPYARPEADLGIARSAIKKPIERYLLPKLLVVKSTGHLQAVLDTRSHVVLQTLYLLHIRKSEQRIDTAYFLLALLNSRLLRAYVYHLHTAYKLVQPQIEQAVLARLPVPWGEVDLRREIAARARELEHACSKTGSVVEWGEHFPFLYEEQERAIRALYALATPGIFTDKGVVK